VLEEGAGGRLLGRKVGDKVTWSLNWVAHAAERRGAVAPDGDRTANLGRDEILRPRLGVAS